MRFWKGIHIVKCDPHAVTSALIAYSCLLLSKMKKTAPMRNIRIS